MNLHIVVYDRKGAAVADAGRVYDSQVVAMDDWCLTPPQAIPSDVILINMLHLDTGMHVITYKKRMILPPFLCFYKNTIYLSRNLRIEIISTIRGITALGLMLAPLLYIAFNKLNYTQLY